MKSKKMTPGRVIALGFAAVILTGTFLLLLPISQNNGVNVSFIDALFTSTSAVCVTGLIAIDTADTFSVFGRFVVALLIQIGGLGITSIGVGFMVLSRRKINMRERLLVKEALNYTSFKGVLSLVKAVLQMTLFFEFTGMCLSFIVFIKDYSFWKALGISAFHSVASFNNSGFDILGNLQGLIPYQKSVLLNLTTCGLIIFGGIGFFAFKDIFETRRFSKFSLHTKVVITVTAFLLILGTIVLKITEGKGITWLGAFLTSTSARTAGFSTFPIGSFSSAGLLLICVLMFIGASPGSTGGGIKTSTAFVIFKSIISASTNKSSTVFKRKIPSEIIHRAFVILTLALAVVCTATFLLCVSEPKTEFMKLFFEVVSAFGTVGLSTGITPGLTSFSKFIIVLTMYIGRLGPLTIASLWVFKPTSNVSYAEGSITIG